MMIAFDGQKNGFTLIELSIVLVIIGLIVGGVLVGQDLIRAAAVRSTISQLEKYQVAANTFKGKYGYLPGDIKDPDATRFGFAARGTYAAEGDGNGIIEGTPSGFGTKSGSYMFAGETGMFWVDLSKAGLIDGGFFAGSPTLYTAPTVTNLAYYTTLYLPQTKLSESSMIGIGSLNNKNYFTISYWYAPNTFSINNNSSITAPQAYNIDKKIDDGLPQTGAILAADLLTIAGNMRWADFDGGPTDITTPTPSGTGFFCYDDGGVTGALRQYAVTTNNKCYFIISMQ
jgi:prepilin-type N-terminal cleavage/methylation domain-containing protein